MGLSGRRRVHGLLFWLGVLGGLSVLAWGFTRLLTRRPGTPAGGAEASSRFRWLLTVEGERRGFALISDLARDGKAWELWGPARGMAALSPISDLRPGTFFSHSGLGINGGYWDEARQPVGVCAGERGIHGTRSHPSGFALTADRAWIGPLTAHVRLAGLFQPTSTTLNAETRSSQTLELAINPQPLPRRTPFLIDPAAFAGEVSPDVPARVAWLERAGGGEAPLRFNSTVALRVSRVFRHPARQRLPEPPEGVIVLVLPERENASGAAAPAPAVGARGRLTLTLEPVRGEVRLATCAGPRLLKDGKISEALAASGDSRAERTWRTAVGCDAAGRRLIVVMLARGRDGLPGATLRETAQNLLDLGASEGLNLDGGSSSSVWFSPLRSELHQLFPLQSPIHHAIFLRKEPAVGTQQP